jgi:hypothetical protein
MVGCSPTQTRSRDAGSPQFDGCSVIAALLLRKALVAPGRSGCLQLQLPFRELEGGALTSVSRGYGPKPL